MLAVVQPGDLGDEETAGPAQETTTTTSSTTSTSTTELTTTTTVVVSTTTTTAPSGEPTTTSTTVPGSGIGQGGVPSGGSDGVADTGGESMIGAGMALGALGLLLRRLTGATRA